jgi:hypothetical protein
MRRHRIFLAILAVAAVSRFVVLLTAETHVHSDEAIIGLMGKHVLEGRAFPFYMYGQSYNAGAAWEAYLAAVPFGLFGVGVVALKSVIVLLSLVCVVLVYRMTDRLYGRPTAILASVAFVLCPSLLKWHFQVRGYSWYFLSLPVLLMCFWYVDSQNDWGRPEAGRPQPPRQGTALHPVPSAGANGAFAALWARAFLFGLVSGLAVWCLELVLAPVAALWLLLLIRRRLSPKGAAAGLLGIAIGYAPAIIFNLTHGMSNWREVFIDKGTDWRTLVSPASYGDIFLREMPKFFGPDTVLWYYPETPAAGYVFYAIAIAAVGVAIFPFLRSPGRIGRALGGGREPTDKDLVMLFLTAACFAPYLIAPMRVPGYFLGGCFFLSVLAGRLLARAWEAASFLPRFAGAALFAVLLVVGGAVLIDVGRRNEIETLTLDKADVLAMTRIPGADLEAVEDRLRQEQVACVWTTVSFVYPLLFETGEKLAVSDAIFGTERHVYPTGVPRRLPNAKEHTAFVVETDSPNFAFVMAGFGGVRGVTPVVSRYQTLCVIDVKPRGH